MRNDIEKLKGHLYEALNSCAVDKNKAPDVKLSQDLRVTDQIMRSGKNIIIAQSQSVDIKIIGAITQALQICDKIQSEHPGTENEKSPLKKILSEYLAAGVGYRDLIDTIRAEYIALALRDGLKINRTAKRLGVSRGTIQYYQKKKTGSASNDGV